VSISNRVANLTIRTKIIISFATILALFCALAATALLRLSAMNETTQTITDDYVPSVFKLGTIAKDFSNYRGFVARQLLNAEDLSERRRYTGEIANRRKSIIDNVAAFAPLVDPGAEEKLYADVQATTGVYFLESDHQRAMVADGKIAEAVTFNAKTLVPLARRVEAALNAEVDYNVQQVTTRSAEDHAGYLSARLTIAGASGLALFVAVLAGLFLVRSIAAPILAMTRSMHRLAEHDMDAAIPAQGRTDEVGRMAESVQVFKDALTTADRLSVAQKHAESMVKRQRVQRVDSLTKSFDASVGGVVSEVVSQANELHATACSMSATAEET